MKRDFKNKDKFLYLEDYSFTGIQVPSRKQSSPYSPAFQNRGVCILMFHDDRF